MASVCFNDLLKRPVHLLAFGLGSGLSPYAPGTMGTIVAIPLYWLVHTLPVQAYLLFVLLMFVVGVAICGRTASDLGVHDHPGIVWDEWVGLLITMTAVPATPVNIIAGFLLFRFFDIVKPWPIGWVDRKVAGGTGIMLDDVLAGVMAYAVLSLLQ